jgi:DNA polymerase III subunit beta
MKITCEASALQGALALVKPAVSGRPRIPILASVLFEAAGDRVRLSATDLGLGIACWLPAQIEREGAVAVPYARLVSWTAGLAAPARSRSKRKGAQQELAAPAVVALEVAPDSQGVAVNCGRRRATMPGGRAEDFPALPTFEAVEQAGNNTVVELDLPLFCTMVEQVSIASDPRNAREPYGQLVLQVAAGRVTLAARNEGTLAQCEGAMLAGSHGQLSLALPAHDAEKIARVLRVTGHGSVQVAVEREWPRILFHTPGLDLVTSLFEPGFTELGQQVPHTAGPRVVVEREALAAALAFVAFVARRNGHVVDLLALPESGTLLVEARDTELGEQATEVEVTSAEAQEGFRCEPVFGLFDQLVTTAGGTSIELAWYAEPGTLVLRSQLDAPPCLTTYTLLHTRAARQGGRP